MSFGKERGILLGWLLGIAIYTQSSRAILLPNPDLAKSVSIYWFRYNYRGFWGWLLLEWSITHLAVILVIHVLACFLWRADPLSILPSMKNWRLVYLLGGPVSASFQSTASSCKLSSALHFVFKHQNREDCHIFGWGDLWEEEDNIDFGSDIMCVIFANMPWTRFYKKKDDASEGDS